ncbi:MAG TPA: alpha/beta hydrolase [Gryllotalpicola sp.]
MDLDAVDPALRDATERLPVPKVGTPLGRRAARLATRVMAAPDVAGVRVRAVHDGALQLHVYEPDAVAAGRPGLVWVHGGGYVIGSWKQDHRLCAEAALRLGATVVSAEYRLAPEHPFPTPLDDVAAVWEWLQREARALGVDPRRIALGGESAGAGLAACLAQRLLDAGGVTAAAQWLFAPMLDDATAADRALDAVGHWVWTNAFNRVGWEAYLGQDAGRAEAPAYAVAARRADLGGLPPAWIGVGDIDLFHAEDVRYAERLRMAGVPVELDVVPGGPHGFENWARDAAPAQALRGRALRWLATALAPD